MGSKIKKLTKKLIDNLTPRVIYNYFTLNYRLRLNDLDEYLAVISYSQFSEDLELERLFKDKTSGFYVDVGAHHPKRFSNTYKLYLKGWKGINIDANAKCIDIFNKERPRDVNLNLAISDIEEEKIYYSFNDHAINTFDGIIGETKSRNKYNINKKVEKIPMKLVTLSNVLDNHLPIGTKIDLFSIDVEGFDLKVLKSNDWGKYRPYVIIIEEHGTGLYNFKNSKTYNFLKKRGYILEAICGLSMIFKLIDDQDN